MNNSDNTSLLNLSKIAELTTFGITISFAYSALKMYIYYILLLHIPIFQFTDISDIVILMPTGIFWAIYLGGVQAANFVIDSNLFDKWERIFYGLLIYSILGGFIWIGYKNDPIIKQVLLFILSNWWYLIPFVLYILVRMRAQKKGDDFFKKNLYISALCMTFYYSAYESFSSYDVLLNSKPHLHYIFKMNNGQTISTNKTLLYVGRTKNYWFLYNKNTHYTRAFKNDDVSKFDFDEKLK